MNGTRIHAGMSAGLLLAGAVVGCAAPTPEERGARSFTILFAGDTSYGENYQEAAPEAGRENILESRGYDAPFRDLDPLLSASDLVVANLETPITDLEHSPLTGNHFIHWSDIDKAPAGLRRHGIGVVSLANNHSMDFGPPGLLQSLAVLADAGIESFGAGEDEKAAGAPWRRDIRVGDAVFPLRIIGAQDYGSFLEESSFYARDDAPGVYLLDEKETAERLRSLKREEPDSFVVVFPHWGFNYRWRNRIQQLMAHRLADAGADLILGHGAHMLQEIEQFHGKWIAYGLGNFMFLSGGRYARFRAPPYSLPARLIVERENGRWKKTLRFYPIVSDNIKTRYRPRPVTDSEFSEVYEMLVRKSGPRMDLTAKATTGKDGIGHYIEIRLD